MTPILLIPQMAFAQTGLELAAIGAGAGILQSFLGRGRNERIRRLQEEVLEEQRGFAQRLTRLQRGDLTPQETQAVTRTATRAVAPSLAARGLSRSPAAAQAIGAATGQALQDVQFRAAGLLGPVQQQIQQTALGLLEDESEDGFFGTISEVTGNLSLLRGMPEQRTFLEMVQDPTFLEGAQMLRTIFGTAQGTGAVPQTASPRAPATGGAVPSSVRGRLGTTPGRAF